DAQGRVDGGEAVDEVVDLLVGLGDDHLLGVIFGELAGGADDEGGFARAGWGIDDEGAVRWVAQVVEDVGDYLVRGGHARASGDALRATAIWSGRSGSHRQVAG